MSASKANTKGDTNRGAEDAPLHTPGQLLDAPPVGGGASGSGDAGGSDGGSSGKAEDAPIPHADSDAPGEVTPREEAPPQGDEASGAEANQDASADDVELQPFEDPAAAATAFASVGQLLVTQQIISRAIAKYIFQGELDLAKSNSAAAAAANPALHGQVPPVRFGVRQDPSSFVVGVLANNADQLTDRILRDGYGGLETLAFVETLSDEDTRDLSEVINPEGNIRPELLLPRVADSSATVSEFRDLLDSIGAKRELASLLQHYPVEGLARKVFKMSTLLKRTLVQLREAKRQLRSSGSRDGSQLLEKLTEISDMKTGFALLKQHWKEAFLVSKRQHDQETADHARYFKCVAQNHEREEKALRSKLAAMTQERDDMFSYARSLKNQLKAGSLNVPQVMNYLNQHQTRVVGNWPRLKSLLEHRKDHKTPPNDWTTQILVNAIVDYSAQPGPFATLDEEDSDEEKKEDSGSGPTSGSKNAPLDFTQDSTPPSTPRTPPSKQGKHPSAGSRKLQLRPNPYTPSDKDALDPRKSLTRTVEEARTSLDDHAVVWDKQRTDLQLIGLSGRSRAREW